MSLRGPFTGQKEFPVRLKGLSDDMNGHKVDLNTGCLLKRTSCQHDPSFGLRKPSAGVAGSRVALKRPPVRLRGPWLSAVRGYSFGL